MSDSRTVLVPRERVVRWFDNFAQRHEDCHLTVTDGSLQAVASDGATAHARLPFSHGYDGPPAVGAFAEAVVAPASWGVLLVRKGGFAVARLAEQKVVDSKVGQRHVQGRTKAGGQSQQRFARRRDNQARAAYEAAAGHAARVLGGVGVLVCGGDRAAVEAVLQDPRLQRLAPRRVGHWHAVPDPRRAVLDRVVQDARAAVVTVKDPPDGDRSAPGL